MASVKNEINLLTNTAKICLARSSELYAVRKSVAVTTANSRRSSLGLSFLAQMSVPEIASHMRECIQHGIENKFNMKITFNLPLVEYIAYLIKKQDGEMSDLQTATVSLDASTKIYGSHVDSIHTAMIKFGTNSQNL